MKNEDTIEALNDLLTKAYDAEQGYTKAAERAEEAPHLQAFCHTQASQRLSFGKEIKEKIGQYGGEPDKGASVVAKAHQVWITIKDVVSSDDEEAILEECVRGEEAALEEYNEILREEALPGDVIDMIRSQRAKVMDSLQAVRIKEKIADSLN